MIRSLARRLTGLLMVAVLCGGLMACGSKISQSNFDKIQEGMTQKQVIAILGEPTESTSASLMGLSGTSSKWTDGKAVISIQFFNGKVKMRNFSATGDAKAK